ncbi:hypothetical protein BDW67DRAFT_179148 [Aspergillus spinulosporus]
MPEPLTYQLHPYGLENDPEEERFKLSTLNYLSACTYSMYALFFRLDESLSSTALDALKAVKCSTVKFVVQWVDKDPAYTSSDEIEASYFSTVRLGDLKPWSLAHQLAENCHAILSDTPFAPWDPANLDLSRLTKPEPAEEDKVDGPAPSQPNKDQLPVIALLFHLPRSKAAELKRLATPEAKAGGWISTYDAFSPFILRTLTRLRAPAHKPDTSKPISWVDAVDMGRRVHSPPVPARLQGNVMSAALNTNAPPEIIHPTIADIISPADDSGKVEWPLWKLASYIRQLTNSVAREGLDAMLTMLRIHDKAALKLRIDCQLLISILQTDHQDTNIPQADLGVARSITYRYLLDFVTSAFILIYPARVGSGPHGGDEGCEFPIVYECELAQTLIDDPEWNSFFEFRGVDAVDVASTPEVPK